VRARAGHDRTLAQWIIQRRLERARNQLADLDPELTSITAIARGCGFANLSHFSQRFRAAYVTPRMALGEPDRHRGRGRYEPTAGRRRAG
jgi:AraC-like DNA-binding protein